MVHTDWQQLSCSLSQSYCEMLGTEPGTFCLQNRCSIILLLSFLTTAPACTTKHVNDSRLGKSARWCTQNTSGAGAELCMRHSPQPYHHEHAQSHNLCKAKSAKTPTKLLFQKKKKWCRLFFLRLLTSDCQFCSGGRLRNSPEKVHQVVICK